MSDPSAISRRMDMVGVGEYGEGMERKRATYADLEALPDNMVGELAVKLPVYAREGVNHVWLVDAESRTLEVFRREEDRYTLLVTHTGLTNVRAEPFDAIELELDFLWGDK
jgi:hypothetical protein